MDAQIEDELCPEYDDDWTQNTDDLGEEIQLM